MTIKEIKQLIQSPQYDFLRTDEHLRKKIILLTLGGSYAYGTNTETSDIDIRGCALHRRADLVGMSNFEQVINKETDTTIYSFNKLISLLCSCNPNTIELLGCKPEHYLYLDDLGRQLVDYQKMFLSKRAVNSFGGYANQQLRRLENAVAHDKMPQSQKEGHILKSMQGVINSFNDRYAQIGGDSIKLYTAKSSKEGLDTEIFADITLSHYPVRDFVDMTNDMTNVTRSYDKLNSRNNKKDNAHLNKHAMHLIRLYLTGIDILEKEEVITYREKEHDLLMDIRNGEFQNEDGTYRSEFFDMVNDFEKRFNYAKENTSLPNHPNMKVIEEFVMSVNIHALKSDVSFYEL